ncbi:MAG: DUF4395 domain-containing protein [Candidatus Nanopelagicales bacterium]
MTSPLAPDARTTVDPRGPRFGASITVVVLAAALVTAGSPIGLALIAWQTLVFALGAFVGLYAQPYGVIFRKLICPRLTPPTDLEDAAPPRFAQLVGFVFLAIALVATLAGASAVAIVAVGFALAAAFLNAAFNVCLGCEIYLIGKRVLVRA